MNFPMDEMHVLLSNASTVTHRIIKNSIIIDFRRTVVSKESDEVEHLATTSIRKMN